MYFLEERLNKLIQVLAEAIYPVSVPVTQYRWKKTAQRGLESADVSQWETFDAATQVWQGFRTEFWFVTDLVIPEQLDGQFVEYALETGADGWEATNPQFFVYVDGKLIQGMDTRHRSVVLTPCAKAGDRYHLALFANTSDNDSFLMMKGQLRGVNKAVETLYYDLKIPLEAAEMLEEGCKTRIDMVAALTGAANLLDLRQVGSESFAQSVLEATRYLETEFYQKMCGSSEAVVDCVGHTHIDVAWLWTLSVTRDKAVRTFATMLELMRRYPEFVFMSSQPQLYQYVKEDAPEVFEEIRQRVAEGRWEAEGAMWLEADCNISSGESLVRQVLQGTRFFEKEFGVRNCVLWLPDVFGYSAALPHILQKSEIPYFMTTKISWNEYNKMPYDTFKWRGIDGTEVLTHFIPATDYQPVMKTHMTTYNGNLNPAQIKGAWHRYQQKNLNDEVLFSFGYGDGGGGSTAEMMENHRRLEQGIPGCPKTRMSTSRAFFEKLEKDVSGNRYLPTWSGELYLEYHRGTYTTMARNKKYNRKSEFLLENWEKLSSLHHFLLGGVYPQSDLEQGWQLVLRNQFHDILPGSSIKEVYEDSRKEYESLKAHGEACLEETRVQLTTAIGLDHQSVVVYNLSGLTVSEVALVTLPELEPSELIDPDTGEALPLQQLSNGQFAFFASNVPANGYKSFSIRPACAGGALFPADQQGIETPFLRVSFDEKMQFASIYDKQERREVLKEAGNRLEAYEDRPHNHDAWDINIYYREHSWTVDELSSVKIIENGPVLCRIEVTRPFLSSTIRQIYTFYHNLPRIDIENDIDWKEEHILLKAAFPIDVHAEEATYEIQYGNVTRSCHSNTLWDAARFEVCAHKWADFSEDDYGVSMLNDCKFGHDIHDGVMRLTLLKCATYPNVDADRERHQFTYSIYPHTGSWKTAGTVAQAYGLNNPLTALYAPAQKGTLPASLSAAAVDCDNLGIEVVKKAEDSEDLIVRVYEFCNRRTKARLTLPKNPKAVRLVNLLEHDQWALQPDGDGFVFTIQPYEILTFKITF